MPSVSHRRIVAVDLDDTLSHTIEALSAWHNDTYETNLKHSDFHTQNLWEVWGGSREEACQKVREFYTSKHFMDLQPINDYALESLRMLKRRRFSLVIVTSRQQLVAEETKRWVDKCYPGRQALVVFERDNRPSFFFFFTKIYMFAPRPISRCL
jgi:5'(3')-deoxyribonucleotidase